VKVEVDTAELAGLVQQGSEIVFTADAERHLVALLSLKDKVEEAIEQAKEKIEQTALKYNPNFTAVYGTEVVVGYRHYGHKYRIDDKYLDELPEQFYKRRVSYTADSTAVDKYIKAGGQLPLGISPTQRSKKITIKRKEDFESEGDE
jgi:CTP synthase (UTP-ammonia lyase)